MYLCSIESFIDKFRLQKHSPFFTTWGCSPQVVPKIEFSPRNLYLFIYLFIYLYVTLAFLLYTLYWRNNNYDALAMPCPAQRPFIHVKCVWPQQTKWRLGNGQSFELSSKRIKQQ